MSHLIIINVDKENGLDGLFRVENLWTCHECDPEKPCVAGGIDSPPDCLDGLSADWKKE